MYDAQFENDDPPYNPSTRPIPPIYIAGCIIAYAAFMVCLAVALWWWA